MSANDKQVGGTHYQGEVQHWDWAADMPYLEGRCTAYVARHQGKNGVQDLEKALHFMQKILEKRYDLRLEYSIGPLQHSVGTDSSQNPYANIDPKDENW